MSIVCSWKCCGCVGVIKRLSKYRTENFILISWDCLHLIAFLDMLTPKLNTVSFSYGYKIKLKRDTLIIVSNYKGKKKKQ